jgi:hypothetical protein
VLGGGDRRRGNVAARERVVMMSDAIFILESVDEDADCTRKDHLMLALLQSPDFGA